MGPVQAAVSIGAEGVEVSCGSGVCVTARVGVAEVRVAELCVVEEAVSVTGLDICEVQAVRAKIARAKSRGGKYVFLFTVSPLSIEYF